MLLAGSAPETGCSATGLPEPGLLRDRRFRPLRRLRAGYGVDGSAGGCGGIPKPRVREDPGQKREVEKSEAPSPALRRPPLGQRLGGIALAQSPTHKLGQIIGDLVEES